MIKSTLANARFGANIVHAGFVESLRGKQLDG
jgi:hypothetical protein